MSSSSVVEESKALISRFIEEIWNQGNVDGLDKFVVPTLVCHHPRNRDADLLGIESFRQWTLEVRRAFPDIRLSVEQIFGEGDKIVIHLRGAETYAGTSPGVTASGKLVNFTVTGIARLASGRLAEAWIIADDLGILQQLGVVRRLD